MAAFRSGAMTPDGLIDDDFEEELGGGGMRGVCYQVIEISRMKH